MANSIQGIRTWQQDPDGDRGDATAGPPDDANAAERTARAAANARFQAFVSSPPTDEACRNFAAPNHDYDQCVRANVPNPVLFQKQGPDVEAVDPRDVQQGGLGDCHFLAPLAALASTPQGRALIRGAVVENKNDKGSVVSWTVTLHQPTSHLFGQMTFRDVQITVGGSYVIGHARARTTSSQNGAGQSEVWPLVFEKAYAQYAGGYNKIGRGGAPVDAMTVLTGRKATYVSLDWPGRWFSSYGVDKLQSDLASGKMVVLSTRTGIGGNPYPDATPAEHQANVDAHGLLGDHAYFAQGIEQHNGRPFLRLGNPWGETQPDLVPCDELTKWFSSVSIGAVQ